MLQEKQQSVCFLLLLLLSSAPSPESLTHLQRNLEGKNSEMWKEVSVIDGLPAKRIEKLNNSEKEKLLKSLTTFLFRVVQFSIRLAGGPSVTGTF